MKEQLISAHAEVEKLNLEIGLLEQELDSEKQKNGHYRNLNITSVTSKKKNKLSRSAKRSYDKGDKDETFNISARKLNLDIDFHTPKSSLKQQIHFNKDVTLNTEYEENVQSKITENKINVLQPSVKILYCFYWRGRF